MKLKAWAYQRCPLCDTPYMEAPIPEGFTYTVRGKQLIPYLSIHVPDCPRGFKKVVIPDE